MTTKEIASKGVTKGSVVYAKNGVKTIVDKVGIGTKTSKGEVGSILAHAENNANLRYHFTSIKKEGGVFKSVE